MLFSPFTPPHIRKPLLLVALATLLAVAMGGCDSKSVALLRSADAGQIDASQQAAGQVVGTGGFEEWAGLTIYGRLGPLSNEIASATIQSDGTFTMLFPPVVTWFDQAQLELYVDVNGDMQCGSFEDAVGTAGVMLVRDETGFFTVEIASSDLGVSLFGCGGLNP